MFEMLWVSGLGCGMQVSYQCLVVFKIATCCDCTTPIKLTDVKTIEGTAVGYDLTPTNFSRCRGPEFVQEKRQNLNKDTPMRQINLSV